MTPDDTAPTDRQRDLERGRDRLTGDDWLMYATALAFGLALLWVALS